MNEPPERDVLVTGLDESQQIILKEACEDIGPVQSIKFHKNPKTRIFMGIVSLSYSKAGDGKKAVSNLNGKTIGGSPVIMVIDDKGELCNVSMYTCTVHVYIGMYMIVCVYVCMYNYCT